MSTLMCYSRDDHFALLDPIDDAEREAMNQDAPETVRDIRADLGPLADRIDGTLYVIEEDVSEAASRGLVEQRGFGHLFLRRRKETIADHRTRLRARAMASSPGTASTSPRR